MTNGQRIGCYIMVKSDLPLPVWIWHPERERRLRTHLRREFSLEMDIENATLGIALTGGARVFMDSFEILHLPEGPDNVCRFHYAECVPLKAGKHRLEMEIECQKPMPQHGAISFAHDRTVGCIAWLEGDGFRLLRMITGGRKI